MPELEIKQINRNSVMRIEICLPRSFRGSFAEAISAPTEVIASSITDIGGEQ